jgi:hypothetical protein
MIGGNGVIVFNFIRLTCTYNTPKITVNFNFFYFKYLEIFKSCRFTLDHFWVLTQPSRLSSCDLRSPSAFLLSGPL